MHYESKRLRSLNRNRLPFSPLGSTSKAQTPTDVVSISQRRILRRSSKDSTKPSLKKSWENRQTYSVNCRGCGRLVGYVERQSSHAPIYCSIICMVDIPISENEERDAMIELLTKKFPHTQVAKMFSITRQRVSQIVEQRSA